MTPTARRQCAEEIVSSGEAVLSEQIETARGRNQDRRNCIVAVEQIIARYDADPDPQTAEQDGEKDQHGYTCKKCGVWVSPVCFNCGTDPR